MEEIKKTEMQKMIAEIKDRKEEISVKSLWELQREKLALKWLMGQGFLGKNKSVPESVQMAFIRYCVVCNLDPTIGEISLVQMGQDYVPITSAKVYYDKANQTKELEGYKFTLIDKDENGKTLEQKDWEGITIVKKIGSDFKWEFRTFFREYTKGQASWKTMPYLMFEKCSITNALRKSFPSAMRAMPYAIEENWAKKEPLELKIELEKITGETSENV